MQAKGLPVRKRTQIISANHVMFIWVAGVSVLLGFAIVASIFLIQMIVFNEKVLSKKAETISRLEKNIKNVDTLKDNIRALDADKSLSSIKAKPDDRAIQVVLDALPSEANSLALGASIQKVLLADINGLTIESLRVDPVVGVELLDTTGAVTETSDSGENQISFKAVISGNEDAMKAALVKMDKSIRTINVTNLKIESGADSKLTLTINGVAYYEPEHSVELKDEVVK